MHPRSRQILNGLGLLIAALASGAAAVAAVVWGAPEIPTTRGLTDPADIADELGRNRTAILAIFAGGIAVVGAIYTARTFSLSRRGQTTERFFRAVEHLDNQSSPTLRMGAVYELESIARESPVDLNAVLNILRTYVDHVDTSAGSDDTSTVAAKTVITRLDRPTPLQTLSSVAAFAAPVASGAVALVTVILDSDQPAPGPASSLLPLGALVALVGTLIIAAAARRSTRSQPLVTPSKRLRRQLRQLEAEREEIQNRLLTVEADFDEVMNLPDFHGDPRNIERSQVVMSRITQAKADLLDLGQRQAAIRSELFSAREAEPLIAVLGRLRCPRTTDRERTDRGRLGKWRRRNEDSVPQEETPK